MKHIVQHDRQSLLAAVPVVLLVLGLLSAWCPGAPAGEVSPPPCSLVTSTPHGVLTEGAPLRATVRRAAAAGDALAVVVRSLDADGRLLEEHRLDLGSGDREAVVELRQARRFLRLLLSPVADPQDEWGRRSLVVLPPAGPADRRFGLNARPDEAPLVGRLGAYWVRTHLPWEQGGEDQPLSWQGTDRIIEAISGAGCGLFAISSYGLPWATVVAEDDDRGMAGFFSVPRAVPWDAYVRGAARHTRGRLAIFEVWNEPNFDHFWRSLPNTWEQRLDDYTDLLKRTHTAMKEEAPELRVTTGSIVTLSSRNAGRYFQGLLERGGGAYFDVLNLHYYRARLGPEADCSAPGKEAHATDSLAGFVGDFRHRMLVSGIDRPIWITEMGWPTQRPPWGWGEVEISERDQAAFLVRSHVLAFANGVEAVLWFQLTSADFGIADRTGPKPALAAYAQLTRALAGREFTGRLPAPPGIHAYRFDGTEAPLVVAWSVAPAVWEPRLLDVAGAQDALGEDLALPRSALPIGLSPIYLTIQAPGPRLALCPPTALVTLNRRDGRDDYTAYEPSQDQVSEVNAVLATLPPMHRRVLKQRLAALCFVNNYAPGSGIVPVGEGPARRWYLIINSQMLTAGLSDWLALQEFSCFVPGDPHVDLQVDCGTRTKAFAYAVLRESTRIVDETLGLSSATGGGGAAGPAGWPATFATDVWQGNDLRDGIDFAARAEITFFGHDDGPKISFDRWEAVYNALARTPLVSLRAALSPGDDLAEFVTFWHLTRHWKRPFRVHVGREWPEKQLLFEREPMKEPGAGRAAAMAFFYREAAE